MGSWPVLVNQYSGPIFWGMELLSCLLPDSTSLHPVSWHLDPDQATAALSLISQQPAPECPDLCSSRHQMAGANVVSASASTIRRTWPKDRTGGCGQAEMLSHGCLQNGQGRRSTQPTADSRPNCKSGGYIA